VRRATIFVLCLLAAAFVVAPSAQAAFVSRNGLIAFRSDRTGAPDVFSMDAVGGTLVNLTESPAVRELGPAWSPDGLHLALTRTTHDGGRPDLYVVNENGSARTRLTRTSVPERDPAWSPDGTRIAFAARTDRDGPFRIFMAARTAPASCS
jgi:dipeptidyl aminopeptidase/acylaminoacyl peptidase